MRHHGSKGAQAGGIAVIVSTCILLWDYFTPLGVADGMLYAIPVILTLFAGSERLTISTIVLGILLTIAGFFVSPPLGILWIVILNRVLSIITLLAIGILALRLLAAQRGREVAEQAASDLNHRLMESNKELELFAHTISHDLKAPLHSIRNFSTVLEEDFGPGLGPEARELLHRIGSGADRMNQMIGAILSISQLSRTEMQIESDTDLSTMARSIIETLTSTMPNRVVSVVIQPNIRASCDPVLMRIALQNLLGNAWKFTMKTQYPRIEFGCKDEGGKRVFFVRDNGVGFDQLYKDRLFHLFSRLHSATDFEGTGTGLATVKRIIDRHSGRIWTEGNPGKGACFYFTLDDVGVAVTQAVSRGTGTPPEPG